MKEFNERLVLQVVRQAGEISKSDISRRTSLSMQHTAVIVNRLLEQELLVKKKRRKNEGKVGQPAVPIALNPDGAFSIGIKIGRRSVEVLLTDFVGRVLHQIEDQYAYPDPDFVFARIDENLAAIMARLSAEQTQRMVGIGIAAPHGVGNFPLVLGGPSDVLKRWEGIDIRQRITATQDLPVFLEQETTAACLADIVLRNDEARVESYLYVFIGTIIGGGVVLDGTLYRGAFDYAGAVGPMPIPRCFAPEDSVIDGPTVPLLECASRYLLDERLRSVGADPYVAVPPSGATMPFATLETTQRAIQQWMDIAAPAIAVAIVSACSTIDFEGVVIAGALPNSLVSDLKDRIESELDKFSFTGLVRPPVTPSDLGSSARALGAAILPLYSTFAPDRTVLLKRRHDTTV